jgi:hypothetical protein
MPFHRGRARPAADADDYFLNPARIYACELVQRDAPLLPLGGQDGVRVCVADRCGVSGVVST